MSRSALVESDPDGLTIMQRKFVDAYLGEANGVACKAAEIAGYCPTSRTAGIRTLYHPAVQAAIRRILTNHSLSADYTKNAIIQTALTGMDHFIAKGDDGEVTIDFDKAAELGAIGAIKEYTETETETETGKTVKRTIKLHDRVAALALAAKLHGLLTERVDHTSGGQPMFISLKGVSLENL